MTAKKDVVVDIVQAKKRRKKTGSGKSDQASTVVSQDSLASSATRAMADDFKFDYQRGVWRYWNGHKFQKDESGHVRNWLRLHIRDETEHLDKSASRWRSSSVTEHVLRFMADDPRHGVHIDEWDIDPNFLNTPDCLVDLRTGEQLAHDRQYRCTRATACGPEAKDPILFQYFLKQITQGDAGLQEYLQRIVGYAITGLTSEQCFWFFYGPGANGKSIFLDIIRETLGDYGQVASAGLFMEDRYRDHPTAIAGLHGARFVTSQENDKGAKLNETLLKEITGGGRISAREMRKDFYEAHYAAKIFLAGNNLPELKAVNEALKRRLLIVPFGYVVPAHERDPKLMAKLRAEKSGILDWAIEGAVLYNRYGLKAPQAVREATNQFFKERDDVQCWLDACTVSDSSPGEFTSTIDLFESFQMFCRRSGVDAGTKYGLGQALKERGFADDRRRTNGQQQRGFKGIRLSNEELFR